MDMGKKVAIVTGASAGIGRAYALALAGAGATVVAAARTPGSPDGSENNTLAHVVRSASSLPGTVHASVCDVLDESAIIGLVDETVASFGRVDILVNNAALMWMFRPFAVGAGDWDKVMRVNVRAPYVAISRAAPHMIRQRSGSIINITARAGEFMSRGDRLHDGTVLYAMTKAALNRLTFFMSEELRPYGIAVNSLSPGVVATETALRATPGLKDYGGKDPTPQVLGPALLCLAGQTASGLTGQILHTDNYGKTWPG
jgi:NAD(P)-dependent dehydrogenase (short-subunit alcohol dehydrogenase family)